MTHSSVEENTQLKNNNHKVNKYPVVTRLLRKIYIVLETDYLEQSRYNMKGSEKTFMQVPVLSKNLETRSEHLKILPISDLVQTLCMFSLEMDISESGLRQVWIFSQMQTCSRPDSDLELTPGVGGCDKLRSGKQRVCSVQFVEVLAHCI